MDVAATHLYSAQVFGQFFRHALGQGRHEHALVTFHSELDLFYEVIDLVLTGPDLDLRVEKTRRAYYLFHVNPFGVLQFIISRGGADVDHLVLNGLELLEFQRSVVHGSRKPESVFHEVFLS